MGCRIMNDWPFPEEAEVHIRSEFLNCGINFKARSKNFQIPCPIPGCASNPNKRKLEITKDGKKAHCWVCDWRGNWNSLAPYIGARGFNGKIEGFETNIAETDFLNNLVSKFNNIQKEEKKVELPMEELSIWKGINDNEQPWRGLSVSFLQKLPAFMWHQKVEIKDQNKIFVVPRIMLPFYQNNQLVGYTGRRLDDSDIMRYDNASIDTSHVFYPFDYFIKNFKTSYVVLVEGPIDALWLLYNNIPSLSILGSTNWSDEKLNLLLLHNIKNIITCMDNDNAGIKAVNTIYNSVHIYMDKFINITLPKKENKKIDPGELNINQINWLKSYIKKILND